jgi:alpha-ribazole phosphatase/probable phosphoglycerate mutase
VTEVWLIRHGETAAEYRGRCYGSSDVELSETGIRQMQAVAAALTDARLSAVYCSPRTRCRTGAQLIAAVHACPVRAVSALRELDFGEFEGRTYDEIASTHPDIYKQWMQTPTEVRFPGGEGFAEMRDRVLAVMEQLRRQNTASSFAVVAHGGVNRIVLADALGIPAAKIFRIGQKYAAMNLVQYYEEQPIVQLVNA